MALRRFMLGWVAFATCAVAMMGQTVSVVNTPIVVSAIDGNIDVYLKVEPIAKDAKLPDLTAEDVTSSDKSLFQQIGNPTLVGRSDTRAYWKTSWHVDGQVANQAPLRALLIKFGATSELLSVTLQKPSPPQVTVTGPGYPLKLSDSHDLPFQIVSSNRLTHVAPAFATLVEEKTGQAIPVSRLSIVDPPKSGKTTQDDTTVEVPGQVVYLRVPFDFSSPGKFTGNVVLSSREKADLGIINITIYSTDWSLKLLGGLCVLLGVAIYFGVAIWAKSRNEELAAELPAAQLREQVQSLKKIVLDAKRQTNVSFSNLLGPASNPNSIDALLQSLSVQNLKAAGYLPQSFFGAFSNHNPSPAYQTFLATSQNRLASLSLIVGWGIVSILRKWPDVEKLGKQAIGGTALTNLDNLAGGGLTPIQLTTTIQSEIAAVDGAISSGAGGGGAGPGTPVGDMGSKEIIVQLQELSTVVWVLWGVVTVFVGLCALVLFNDGFGRPQDYIQCVLWGIGMPAVAQGFGGLTAGSVTSALSLPIPR
jgi:hypothetical protein